MKRNRLARTLAVAGVVSLFTLGTAMAAHKLILDAASTGGVDVIVTDGGAGDLDGLVNGTILYSGTVAGYVVNVTTSVSKPVLGGPYVANMHLNDVSVQASGVPDTLDIISTDTDFSIIPFPGPAVHDSSVGGTISAGSITFTDVVDYDNLEFGGILAGAAESTLVQGPFGPVAFAGYQYVGTTGTNPFSMSTQAHIVTPGVATLSFDDDHRVLAPEASSMALLLPGLLPLGLVLRRRLKKSA